MAEQKRKVTKLSSSLYFTKKVAYLRTGWRVFLRPSEMEDSTEGT
jgi:hypothetical protein